MQVIDRSVTVTRTTTVKDHIRGMVSNQRVSASLVGLCGLLALSLAAVGVYGVVSYATSRRTHEIGIRMALGATAGDVIKLVLRQGAAAAAGGLAAGLATAFALTRLIAAMLPGISATDPVTFVAVSALLLAVALAATWAPAWRAVRFDPAAALRQQ